MKYKFLFIPIVMLLVLMWVFIQRAMAGTPTPFAVEIKGVAYNPTSIGSDQLDIAAPRVDVPMIASLGANTISTYNLGKFEWKTYSDVTTGEKFYDELYPVAETYNLKIIVGYFSNQTIDWTNAQRVAKVTQQYQELVMKAKNRPSTSMYLLGNEVFEYLGNNEQKRAYAKWIGEMVNWTHGVDQTHMVSYADNATHAGLGWLKLYAPDLDVYSFNNYEWETADQLRAIVSTNQELWPGKLLLLHEWGVDSYSLNLQRVDEPAQALKIGQLASIVNQESLLSETLLGGILFEYSDQWNKVGLYTTQDGDNGWPWLCLTCFDKSANEDFWGIVRASAEGASNRTLKQAYEILRQVWSGTYSPTPTPNSSCRYCCASGCDFTAYSGR